MDKSEIKKEYSKLYNKVQEKDLSEGQFFEWLSQNERKFRSNEYYANSINGFISDIGFDINSEKVLKCAISRMNETYIESNKSNFDMGNTYLRLGQLKIQSHDSFNILIDSDCFRKGAKALLKVSADDKDYFLRSRTNYANVLKTYGRIYEALLIYDEILEVDPNFGIALVNQATGWLSYIKLYPSEHKPTLLLKKAHENLNRSLDDPRLVSIAGEGILTFVQENIKYIENYLSVRELKAIKAKNPPFLMSKYQRFCITNNLYLNFDLGYYYDKDSLRDSFFPHAIESLEESLQSPGMSKKTYYTFQIFNQILEDFSTARLIYFESSDISLRNYDNNVNFIYALDYSRNSHRYGKIKASFTLLSNCLDKIAHLIRFYFKSIESSQDLYFNWLTSTEFKTILKQEKKKQLLALHSLALDFQRNEIFHSFKSIRNRLTHSFVKVTVLRNPMNEEEISNDDLKIKWLDLCQRVKAALYYSILAIEPNREETTLNLPLYATFQHGIY
ncbi:hypothetical protein LPTSP2_37600 [Leptospira ellinghausenii]|uniref:LA2681-like HEPN domain-containing protein n=1 Tax=Leptospira ellinghausenii TaxID=1917822 RepID=A0A2P2DIG8_9LEPT|nr:LA2681 family HEPN domain-containing protein [Leptospira ellinghausenii]GBF44457.1 hypothetical protein LPTSP2_37600 [Leptospira ellinghausenii]